MPEEQQFAVAVLPDFEHAGRFASERDVGYHDHPGTEFVLVTHGRCRIDAGRPLEGTRGTLFILPAGIKHNQESVGGLAKTTYVVFKAPGALFDESPRTVRVPPNDPMESWLENLCNFYLGRLTMASEVTGALVLACLHRVNSIEQQKKTEALHPGLETTLLYMENHLLEPLLPATLAKNAGLSISHMNALFRRHLKMAPMECLQKMRMDRACKLLADPYARIGEVAISCGFEDVNYFVRVFRKRFGVPPGQWKKRLLATTPGSIEE